VRWPESGSEILDAAAARYRGADQFSRHFARQKLRRDPVYLELLAGGWLPQSGRFSDLGCGRGLLLAVVAEARRCAARGGWPAEWPPPPRDVELVGFDSTERAVRAARGALGSEATVARADLRTTPPPPSSAIVLLDVLHYLDRVEQDRLLRSAAEALEPGGVLLVREADEAAGAGFLAVRLAERICSAARGAPFARFAYRSAAGWVDAVARLGLEARAVPMRSGTPFANVLIAGRRPGR
jgi:trans-aconitate methyltransferase